jgi:LPS sulfotransferase NodH
MELRGYAICTQPRSGSNLMCQYLSSTGRLGYPLEYFNGPARRALGLPNFPDSPGSQIDAILRIGATQNGIYAVKLTAPTGS